MELSVGFARVFCCATATRHCRLTLAVVVLVAGCSDNRNQATTIPETGSKQSLTNDPEQAAELEAAGAKLTRDSQSQAFVTADLSSVTMNDELAANLAQLKQLNRLTMRQSTMSDAGWTQLAALTEMQQLDLRDCPLDNDQLTAAVSGMPKLRALRLSGQSGNTEVDDGGLAVLANCPELKVLAADDLWIGIEGLSHLKQCPQMSELYLKSTLVDDEAMALVADMQHLKKLRLAKTSIGTPGLAAISSLPLEELDISECSQVLDESMAAVGKIKSLKRLNLWRDSVSDTGVAHLVGLSNLEWLNLDNTHLSDAGLEHLRGMTKLTFLHLGSTAVSDAGMPQLTPLQSLKDLKVTRTAVTEQGVQSITQAIPGVDVQLKYIEGE